MADTARELLLNPALYVGPVIVAISLLLLLLVFGYLTGQSGNELRARVRQYGLACSSHEMIRGGTSDFYFDSDLFLGVPKNIDLFVKWFDGIVSEQQRLHGQINRLAFVEKPAGPVGALSLRDLLVWRTGIPALTIRERRRGPAFRVKGLDSQMFKGKAGRPLTIKTLQANGRRERILLVSDVATTGATVLDGIRKLRNLGGHVDTAVVLYDRREGAEELLRNEGVLLVAMDAVETEKSALQ